MWKWICAIVGYILTHRFWGAMVGFFIGQVIDSALQQRETQSGNGNAQANRAYSSGYSQEQARNMFLNALLELSAHIIQADGKIMHSEMELVREFFRASFGEQTMQVCNQRLLSIFKERKVLTPQQCRQRVFSSCHTVSVVLNQESRLQLMAFLCEIAKADGMVATAELNALNEIATALGLASGVVNQLLSLGKDNLEDAYKVLGVSPDATNDEVRKAYRKMALQYHPDRVATLGDDIKEAAKRKFQEINDAKDRIYKARGM